MGYSNNFFDPLKTMMKVCGVWKIPKENHTIIKAIYNFYRLVLLLTSVIYFVCEILILKETIKKLNTFISHFGMLFTHIVGIVKYFMLKLRQPELDEIEGILQNEQYEYEHFKDFQPAVTFQRQRKSLKFLTMAIMISYSGVGISAHISAVINLYTSNVGEYFEGNSTCLEFLPYFSYVPFKTETRNQCLWAFWFMDLPLDFLAWYIATFDATFVAVLCSLKTHFLIVSDAFQSIRGRCLKRLNISENFEILHDESVRMLEIEMYKEIRKCTIHFTILLGVCERVENIFNFVTLAQSLASLMIFASCLFVATTVPLTSPTFFSQLEYFSAVLLQLSTYCWFGNEMTQASQAVRNGIYNSDWLSASRRFKTCMLLNLCRIQRPVYVSIGKFSPLALVTLVSVCRGSFSYFAVFKNVQ